jgi:hypothetical protein
MFLVAGGSPEPCWFFFDLNKKAIVRFGRKRSFRAQDCRQTRKTKGLERMANRGLFAGSDGAPIQGFLDREQQERQAS